MRSSRRAAATLALTLTLALLGASLLLDRVFSRDGLDLDAVWSSLRADYSADPQDLLLLAIAPIERAVIGDTLRDAAREAMRVFDDIGR